MSFILLSFASIAFVNEIVCSGLSNDIICDEDVFRNVTQLITSKGYPVENHIVETSDGYLLSVQRIPHGRKGRNRSGKQPVVLLMHGILGDSANFVWNPPEQSLGFVLADNGYDVWMGNNRGNTYSRNHVRLSPKSEEFWNFSLDELIGYDLPAMINYVLGKTGEKQLSYIGHSQGTTIAFALLSKSPAYNKKIKIFIAMAPVVKLGHMKGIYKCLAPLALALQPFYKPFGLVEILTHRNIFDLFKVFFCATPARFLCAEILFTVFGHNKKQLNYTRLPIYFNSIPAGTSAKSFIHFAQMVSSNKLQMYDYHHDNMELYNEINPPVYDVSKITTPTALISGVKDLVATPDGVDALCKMLNSVVSNYVVPYNNFNHGDFIMAIDAYPLMIEKLLSLLKEYNNN